MLCRAVLVLAVASCTRCVPYYVHMPTDTGGPLAVTFSCPRQQKWCNESWRADRVLRYNLSVYTVRTEQQSQHSGPVLNCRGGQISTDCVLEGSGIALTTEVHTVVNRTLISIEELGPEGLLTTDNFNYSLSELEGSYRGNQDKIWQIKIPRDCQLWILFEEFEVESTQNCEKDYFSVQTSKKQANIRKYCKSLESITVQRRKRVQLWFHADESIQRRGIFARFCFRAIVKNSTRQSSCDCNQGDSHSQRRKRSETRGIQDQSPTSAQYAGKEKKHVVVDEWLRKLRGHSRAALREHVSHIFSRTKQSLEKLYHQRVRQKQHTSL